MIPLRADVTLISQFIDKHSDECNSTLRQADQVSRKIWIVSLDSKFVGYDVFV